MKALQTIALVLFILLAQSVVGPVFKAGAVEFEIGAGQAYAQKAEDGIYYQERFRHDLKLQGEIFTAGITDRVTVWGQPVRWRAFGVLINGFRGDADALQDHVYDPKSATGCVNDLCETFSKYRTELSTRGVAFTVAPEFNVFSIAGKPVIVSPEIGYHLYMARMDEEVYSLDGKSPASSHRAYHYKWGWNGGEVFGIGAEWGNVRLSVRRFKINMANRTTDTSSKAWITDIPSSIGEIVNTVELQVRF